MAISYNDRISTRPLSPLGQLASQPQDLSVSQLAKGLGQAGSQSSVGGQIDALNRLRDSFARAKWNNPEVNALLSPTPTLLSTGTPDGSLTKIYKLDQGATVMEPTGGRFYYSGNNQRGAIATQNVKGDIGNLTYLTAPINPPLPDTGENSIGPYYYKFMTDAIKVQIAGAALAAGNLCRFIVDGQYIDLTGNDFSTNIYYQITFATKKPRTIEFEVQDNFSFFQVAIDPLSRIWKPRPIDTIRAVITGDSHTEGLSGIPNAAWSGCSAIMSRLLGIWDMWIASIGGTGYVKTGTTGLRPPILGQMPYWVNNGKFDMVIFAGGYNDLGFANSAITTAALACWKLARASQPRALIVVFGIWGAARGPDVTLTGTEAAIAAQFAAWADPYSVFIPVSTASEPWEFGTGFQGATNGTGNSDNYVFTDGIHDNTAGQQHRAWRMADAIRQAVFAMTA